MIAFSALLTLVYWHQRASKIGVKSADQKSFAGWSKVQSEIYTVCQSCCPLFEKGVRFNGLVKFVWGNLIGTNIGAQVFSEWNRGELESFLIEITRDILKFHDTDGTSLIDKILDTAGQV